MNFGSNLVIGLFLGMKLSILKLVWKAGANKPPIILPRDVRKKKWKSSLGHFGLV
jgi:hypothetical protein